MGLLNLIIPTLLFFPLFNRMNITKSLLSIVYFAFFMSLLTKNAAILLVLKKGGGLNRLGDFLVENHITKRIKAMPQQGSSRVNPTAVIQKYFGINSAYTYFAPNISEFCQLTFTSSDDKTFFLKFDQFLSSVEGRVKLGTISVLLSSPELFPVRKELFSSIALRVFEENPRIYTLTCNINVIPYTTNREDMIAKAEPQSRRVGFMKFTRKRTQNPKVSSINSR